MAGRWEKNCCPASKEIADLMRIVFAERKNQFLTPRDMWGGWEPRAVRSIIRMEYPQAAHIADETIEAWAARHFAVSDLRNRAREGRERAYLPTALLPTTAMGLTLSTMSARRYQRCQEQRADYAIAAMGKMFLLAALGRPKDPRDLGVFAFRWKTAAEAGLIASPAHNVYHCRKDGVWRERAADGNAYFYGEPIEGDPQKQWAIVFLRYDKSEWRRITVPRPTRVTPHEHNDETLVYCGQERKGWLRQVVCRFTEGGCLKPVCENGRMVFVYRLPYAFPKGVQRRFDVRFPDRRGWTTIRAQSLQEALKERDAALEKLIKES